MLAKNPHTIGRCNLGAVALFAFIVAAISVTIANAKADSVGIELMKMPEFVKEFLIFQSPASVQLTFKLTGKIRVAELIQDNESNNIFVAVHTTIIFPILARTNLPLIKHLSLTRRDVW